MDNTLKMSELRKYAETFPHIVLTTHSSEKCLYGGFQNYLAVGDLSCPLQDSVPTKKPLFGFFSYDFGKEAFHTFPQLEPFVSFPTSSFFEPVHLYTFDHIQHEPIVNSSQSVELIPTLSKEEYVVLVQKIKEHLFRGDVYEINFCFQFYGKAQIDPVTVFNRLNFHSPSPFAAFVKYQDNYLLSASLERYLKREGDLLVSQPIKGTAKRGETLEVDLLKAHQLMNSSKERSENTMIVDLVRNDISMICEPGTVKVDELCGLYSYRHVHQLISTISGKLQGPISWADCFKTPYPMGSMTGAPKHKAVELISKYETHNRGLFSGSVGYVLDNNEFDFNVVIRSILYDSVNQIISVNVGSAITVHSDAGLEYDECLHKAKALLEVLN